MGIALCDNVRLSVSNFRQWSQRGEVMMSENNKQKAVLSLPSMENPPFEKNLIKSAVCELRFPILTSIRSQDPPDQFSHALRKEYPLYERGLTILAGQNETELSHIFKSRDHHWTVSLRPAAVSLETNAYTSFENFGSKLETLAKKLLPLLDTDFYTRVGLRYINVMPAQRGAIDGWLNPALHSLMMTPELGFLNRAWSEFLGYTERGQYNLRWGFPAEPNKDLVLDIDFYAEDVDATDLHSLFQTLHDQSFALFRWCLGDKTIKFMNGE